MTIERTTSTYGSNAGGADQPFRASRLTLARLRRGLSKTDLAAKARISTTSISAHEHEKTVPGPETVQRLAQALGFPTEFFYRGEVHLVEEGAVSFRALTKMSARQRDQVRATATMAAQLLDRWIGDRFDRPGPDLPDLGGLSPTVAAQTLRDLWGFGQDPIPNVVHLLESKGVRVFSLSHPTWGVESQHIDALSMWWDGLPFVFLNPLKTAERARMTALHELGHLVLHREELPRGREAEQEANRFAGEFLVPSDDLRMRARKFNSLQTILFDKRRWGVSALGLVFRLHEEGLLDYWEYRDLNIQIRTRFGPEEPESVGVMETSQVLGKVFSVLRSEGIGRSQVAASLGIALEDLDSLISSHVPTPVPGEGNGGGAPPNNRDGIRLVR